MMFIGGEINLNISNYTFWQGVLVGNFGRDIKKAHSFIVYVLF